MSSLNKNHRLKNIWLPAIVTWILSAVLNYAISPEGFSIVGSNISTISSARIEVSFPMSCLEVIILMNLKLLF